MQVVCASRIAEEYFKCSWPNSVLPENTTPRNTSGNIDNGYKTDTLLKHRKNFPVVSRGAPPGEDSRFCRWPP